MKSFAEIQPNCPFNSNHDCDYWIIPIPCHSWTCPYFKTHWEQNDLDLINRKAVLQVINQITPEEATPIISDIFDDLFSDIDLKRVCQTCGEKIIDDKYLCIPNPKNPLNLIYYHSKGECETRKEGLQFVREEWLKIHSTIKESNGVKKKGEKT